MEQVSNLKMCKVDREEMVDALLDKADVAQLNKIVTMDEYNADLTITRSKQTNADERIQELKDFCNVTFEDVQKSLDARANLDETAYSLRDHQHHLEELDKRMHAVEHEIKPHPAAGVVSFWSNCLSCATPSILAGGDSQDPCPPPMLPPLPVSQPPQKNFSPPSRYCGGPHTSRPSPRFFPVLPPQALTMDCDEIQIPMVRQLTSDHTSFICKCDPNPCDFKPAPGPNNDDAQD